MMKARNFYCLQVFSAALLILTAGCTKKGGDTSSLYTPSSADVTASATLEELQMGRVLYIDKCEACHQLYSPDTYSPSQWRSILNSMAPKAGMSASEEQLVSKYVTRGN